MSAVAQSPPRIDPVEQTRVLVGALASPAAYPHPASDIRVLETHISHVVLAGPFAYKIKKPLRLPFLDYTTLESRRRFCEDEVRLNTRTAPELYLGVVPITGTAARPHVAGSGPPIEYAVRMQRFDEEARFEPLAARGALTAADVDGLAGQVAHLHEVAPRGPADLSWGSPEGALEDALDNFRSIRDAGGPSRGTSELAALEALEAWTTARYQDLRDAMRERQRLGFVRECHGDLHLGNVVRLERGPVLFDCIEFNPRFRWIDVMEDVAFAAMDLQHHGRPDLAARFLDRYLERTGDYAGLRVLPFHLVYRAMVRAKVALIRANQRGLSTPAGRADLADFSAHVALSERLSKPPARALVLMHGVSGSGKSTIAETLLERLGALRLRSDVVRKAAHGLAPLARTASGIGEGLYAPDWTRSTYDELASRARAVLEAGHAAIVDATFLRRSDRERFRDIAEAARAPFVIVACAAPEAILRARVASRQASGADPSDADLAVLASQLATQEPLSAQETRASIACDTSGALPDGWLAAFLERVRR